MGAQLDLAAVASQARLLSATKGARFALAIGEPALYLLVGDTDHCHARWAMGAFVHGTKATKICCISPSARGEVRGYWLVEGDLWIDRSGSYMEWPELDAEVARVTGLVAR